MIACFPEYLWEEGIVTPVTFLSYHMHGKNVLEDKARQVPWRYNVGEYHQTVSLSTSRLSWRCLLVVAIQLGVVLVVALTNYQYDIRTAERTAVHRHFVLGCYELVNLLRCQLVREDAEP